MLVVATLAIAMALSTPPPSAPNSPLSPPQAPDQSNALNPHPHQPAFRRRSHASAIKRRERAIDLGYFQPKPTSPSNVFIKVPRDLRTQAKNIIKGKVLKTTRESQTGLPAHSTRLASLAAYKTNITSKEQFAKDSKTIRRQNAANHGSPKRPRWADIFDDQDDTFPTKIQNALNNGGLTIVKTKMLNEPICDLQGWINWWKNNDHHQGTNAIAPTAHHNIPSPPPPHTICFQNVYSMARTTQPTHSGTQRARTVHHARN
jgi:hypothetical protein